MIKDAAVKADIQQQWKTIIALTKWRRVWMSLSGTVINETPHEMHYNLPLVLAYSTLDGILGQFIIEGIFPCTCGTKRTCFNLGDKMKSAETTIKWADFALVDEGRKARNGVAHHNQLVEKERCVKYIEGIETELKGWGLL